ncbi:MAG: UDP-glucose lipid carrier transferase [uncultured Sulfurovum sp.]|uniref:UDP-glucose lipid carrier transferase n=1 Tax=uncultured Sulfurovum sp. TaxID=269237 RepID=A0A6S6T7Q4_9BACT|nr:MAG: UDP-glucose lipid carrier transferase [uncultured Sulfurovum sp.]
MKYIFKSIRKDMTYSMPKQTNKETTLSQTTLSTNLTNKKVDLKSYQTYTKFQYMQKRTIDFLVGGLLFISSIPVMVYSIYKIKKESPGPIFFKQSRIGINGKAFTCYKFRSMHTNSKFNPYTQENDSRIFPFGNTMRQMRIDELPQLFNIIKGEMHLIGPRAEWDILVKDYEKIIPKYHDRHLVAPGITGLAQVRYPYGRNIQDAKNKLKYDRLYIDSWSLKLELFVIWKTVEVILRKRGM